MILEFLSSEGRRTYVDTDKVLYIKLKLSSDKFIINENIYHQFKCKYFTDGEYVKDFYLRDNHIFLKPELEDKLKEIDNLFQGFLKYETQEIKGTFVNVRYIIYYRIDQLDGVDYDKGGSGGCSLVMTGDRKAFFGLTNEFLGFMQHLERAIPISKL